MPELPIIQPRGQVPSLELPRPGPGSFGAGIGKGLSEFGDTLGKIAEHQQNLLDQVTVVDKKRQADDIFQAQYEDLLKNSDKYGNMTFDDFRTFWQTQQKENIAPLLQDVRPQLIPHVQAAIDQAGRIPYDRALTEYNKIFTDRLRGSVVLARDSALKDAAQASTPEEFDQILNEYQGNVLVPAVRGGYFKAEEGVKDYINFRSDAQEMRFHAAMAANPQEALTALETNDPQFDDIKGLTRDALANSATRAVQNKQTKDRQAEADYRRSAENFLVSQAQQGNLTKDQVDEIANDSYLKTRIDPSTIQKLYMQVAKPIGLSDSGAVKSVEDQYTLEQIGPKEAARQLKNILQNSPGSSDEARAALEKINNNEYRKESRSLIAANREERAAAKDFAGAMRDLKITPTWKAAMTQATFDPYTRSRLANIVNEMKSDIRDGGMTREAATQKALQSFKGSRTEGLDNNKARLLQETEQGQ